MEAKRLYTWTQLSDTAESFFFFLMDFSKALRFEKKAQEMESGLFNANTSKRVMGSWATFGQALCLSFRRCQRGSPVMDRMYGSRISGAFIDHLK